MSRVLPILFNTDMVQAILDERKIVTRRAIKFPVNKYTGEVPISENVRAYQKIVLTNKASFHENPHYCFDVKPLYCRGDILYVRETWHKYIKRVGYGECCRLEEFYGYKASVANSEDADEKWRPSIHMPKEAARIWLKVTDVRVERLQDITGAGIVKEGIATSKSNPKMGKRWENMQRMEFEELWNSTVKKPDLYRYGWEANPWVWVIEFERCGKPEELE